MGFFDSFVSSFNPSNWFGESGNGMLDLMDPGNTFHDSSSKRMANKQYQMEYDIALKNYNEQKRQFDENYAQQEKWNDLNYQQQIEAYNYQKQLNALQMEREDSAVSRRVADLKAAGLSPTLAAGSAASATPVHAGTAPQGVAPQRDVAQMGTPSDVKVRSAMFNEQMKKDRMALAMSMVGNIADVSQTFAQKRFIEAKSMEAETINKFLEQYLSLRNEGLDLSNQSQKIANNWADKLNGITYESKVAEINKVGKQLDLMSEQIKQTKALTKLTEEKWFTEKKEQILKDLQGSKLSADVSKSYLDQMATAYSLKWYQEHGLPYGATGQYAVILSAGSKIMEYVDPVIKDSVQHNLETHSGGYNLNQLKELNDSGQMPKSIFGMLFDYLTGH